MFILCRAAGYDPGTLLGMSSLGRDQKRTGFDQYCGPGHLLQEDVGREIQYGGGECQGTASHDSCTVNSEGAHKYDPIFIDMMPDTEQNRRFLMELFPSLVM